MKTTILALVSMIFCSTAFAQGHLYPESSVFGGDSWGVDYEKQVAALLRDAFDSSVVLRMIELPSFVPESAVGIRTTQNGYEIFTLEVGKQIWGYEVQTPEDEKILVKPDGTLDTSRAIMHNVLTDAPPGTPDITVKKCSVPIAAEQAGEIAKVWDRALHQTRFDADRDLGADGVSYHFAMLKRPPTTHQLLEFLAGQVWMPAPLSVPGRMAVLAGAMRDYCASKAPEKLNDIRVRTTALLKVLP